jgi:AAA+ superfamily predicted ATPase/serine/threonine protein kinase
MPCELHIRWPQREWRRHEPKDLKRANQGLTEIMSGAWDLGGSPYRLEDGVPVETELVAEICHGAGSALLAHDRVKLLAQGKRLATLLGRNIDLLPHIAAKRGSGDTLAALTLNLSEAVLGVPWELCAVGDRLLGELFTTGRVVSGNENRSARWEARAAVPPLLRPPVHVLFVADTSLPGSNTEYEQLKKRLKAKDGFEVFRIEDPRRSDLLYQLQSGDYQILHYAGHGKADDDDPLNNGWQLIDGLFNEPYIRTAGLEKWPRLVFANACATNPLGPSEAHRLGIDSIAVSLLRHGVRHYVSTLTKVPDAFAIDFAEQFYARLLSGSTVGGAISEARAEISRGGDAQSVLAALYVLYGNPIEGLFESSVAQVASASPRRSRGPYTLGPQIWGDSYQKVYSARKEGASAEVLLSILHNQHPALEQGFRELQAKLTGPGVVPILEIGQWDGELDPELVIVRPSISGTPLDVMKHREIPEVCRLALAIARVLANAHEKGFAHGALTPTEIIVSADEQISIQGIGHSQILGRSGLSLAPSEQQERYRSPEQWSAATRTSLSRADLWALAVMTYEMMVGHHPFRSAREQFDGWAEAVLRGRADPASPHRSDVSADLERFLQRALAPQDRDRIVDAADFMRALQRAIDGKRRVGGFDPDLETAMETDATLFSVETNDEPDTVDRLAEIARQQNLRFFIWSITGGLRSRREETSGELRWEPLGAVQWLHQQDVPTLLVLLDGDAFLDDWQLGTGRIHPYLEVGQAGLAARPRSMDSTVGDYDERRDASLSTLAYPKAELRKAVLELAGQPNRHKLVVTSRGFSLPHDLAKAFRTFVAGPCGPVELESILAEHNAADEFWVPAFMLHAAGLTATAVRRALRLSRCRVGKLDDKVLDDLRTQKEQEVRRSGVLELVHPTVTLSADVVGAGRLKAWYASHCAPLAEPFLRAAVPPPRGLALGGLPGTGKSLCAQAIAGELKWPLLRLDIGRIFTRLLGAAESNLRQALALSERMSPSVLWIDDLDASFGRAGDAAGVAGRVLNMFLTWLQERASFVLLIATLRSPSAAPAELLRSGRFDAIFYLDIPAASERASIIEYQLRKYQRSTEGLALEELAAAADGLTGAEIATSVEEALFSAAAERRAQPSDHELRQALAEVRGDRTTRFKALRQSWQTIAMPASMHS